MVKRTSKPREVDEEEVANRKKARDEMELRTLMNKNRMVKGIRLGDSRTETQMKLVNTLSAERRFLVDNLKTMKTRRRCFLDMKHAQDVTNLFTQGDELALEIAKEKQYINDFEAEIYKETVAIQSVKRNFERSGNAIAYSDYLLKNENERETRTLASWKSRLAAEQKGLGKATSENADLRKRIQVLLKEKELFNNLFEELMQKLKKGKKIMADILEQSTAQFQKKDEIARKIVALRSKDKADLVKRVEEIQDLEMKLFEEQKTSKFRQKMQAVREKLLETGRRGSKKDYDDKQSLVNRLETAKSLFKEIQEAVGLETASEIANMLVNEEANLFSLFNFNNEIRDQLEVATQKTADLMQTVQDEHDYAELISQQKEKTRVLLTEKLGRAEEKANDSLDILNANARMFNRLLTKIQSLVEMVKCDSMPLQQLLGNNKEVTELNYRLFLNIIESNLIDYIEVMHQDTAARKTSPITLSKFQLASVRSQPSAWKSTTSKVTSVSFRIDKKFIGRPCTECDYQWRKN